MSLHRREFLKTSALLAGAAALGPRRLAAADLTNPVAGTKGREYYELRAYRLKAGATGALLHAYLEKALIPALNARGLQRVGVFTEPEAKDGPAVWVLITHASLASVAALADIDAQAIAAPGAAEYLRQPTPKEPAFERLDSWLMLAFAGLPQLAVPALTRDAHPRLFELRTYESFSETKARKKVEMFNAGEIELMQQLGMSPVFYGQALVGRDLPHLAYMLCSPDRETARQHWTAFGQHPVWVKLRDDPQYAETVSKITSRFLAPTPYSQL